MAVEIATRILALHSNRVLVSLSGPLTLEGLIGQLISAVRGVLARDTRDHDSRKMAQALDVVASSERPWQDRLGALRNEVLSNVPLLVMLDNFEDNLVPGRGIGHEIEDETLADLLASWVRSPGQSRLLVTSRYPFTLPGGAERALSFCQLGPLSRAETMKLVWSMPALDQLNEGQVARAWRLAGGHPRSLEYADALLTGGTARYSDITARLHASISRRLDKEDRDRWVAARTRFDAAIAEAVSLAADDVLLEELLARLAHISGASDLLLGVSVFREPVDMNAVLFQVGQPDPDAEDTSTTASAAARQAEEVLAAAGMPFDHRPDLTAMPEQARVLVARLIKEMHRRPAPLFKPLPGLTEQIAACQATSLLTVNDAGEEPQFFVHRWNCVRAI